MDKNYQASYEAFERCAELDPDNGRAYLMMGYCSIEMTNYDEAIAKLEKAVTFPDQEEMALQLVKRAKIMKSNGTDS
jgi:tetratricopeptide (TPR) repeat protein